MQRLIYYVLNCYPKLSYRKAKEDESNYRILTNIFHYRGIILHFLQTFFYIIGKLQKNKLHTNGCQHFNLQSSISQKELINRK